MNKFTLLFQNNSLEKDYFAYFKGQAQNLFVLVLLVIIPFNIYLTVGAIRRDDRVEFIIRISSSVMYIIMIFLSQKSRLLFVLCSQLFHVLFSLQTVYFSFSFLFRNPADSFWLGFGLSQIHTLLKGFNWVSDSICYIGIFVIYIVGGMSISGFSLFIVSSGLFLSLNIINSYKTSFFARTSFLSRVESIEQKRLWEFIMKEVFFGSMVLLKPWRQQANSKLIFKSTSSFKLKTMRITDHKVSYFFGKKTNNDVLSPIKKKGTFFHSYTKNEETITQAKCPLFEIEEISERFQEIYGSDKYEDLEVLFSKIDLEGSSITMQNDSGNHLTLFKWLDSHLQELKMCKDFSKNLIKEKLVATIRGKKIEINASIFVWRKEYHILLQFSTDEYYKDELNSMKKLDKYKDRFLASITHDLRTPLFGVEVMIDSALAEPNERERNNFLQIAKINSKLLMNLVGDILDYSQIRESKFRINLSTFSLNTVLEEVGSLMKIQADMRNISLRIRNYCPAACELHSDSKRLKQVLINLISNSLKFTEVGCVELRVSNPNENLLKFEVIDTGHGIDEKDIPFLSQPYNTKDNEKGLNKEGIGLGLFNCKNIVSHLGPYEKLFVSSRLGLGTKFGFIIFQSIASSQSRAGLTMSPPPSIIPAKIKRDRGSSSKESVSQDPPKSCFAGRNADASQNNQKQIKPALSIRPALQLTERFVLENPIEKEEVSNIEEQFSTFMSFIEDEDHDTQQKDEMEPNESLKKNFPDFSDASNINDHMYSSGFSYFHKKSEPVSSTFKRSSGANQSKTKTFGILIVDDNPFNLLILGKFLNKIECFTILIEKANNGKMALDFFKERNRSGSQNPFAIIYMDCMMPIMDGYEATKEIRSMIKKGYKDVQIIGFTSLAGDEEKELSVKAGMDDLLLKPSTEQEIIELTLKLLRDRPGNVFLNV